jgi:UDP-N-acetylmuramoylalanine--D-glutamate ligase
MKEYREAKANIAMNQGEGDFLVLNADDPECSEVRRSIEASSKVALWSFSRKSPVDGVYLEGDTVYYRLGVMGEGMLVRAEEISIKGVHNLENAMAASAMALLAGCPADAVRRTLRDFSGLEHRLEFVREFEGASYVNDSKGTNVGAVLRSLQSFSSPVLLIAGGKDKGGDFTELRGAVKDRVKALVLIGEAKGKIKDALCDLTECFEEDTLAGAVYRAKDEASAGDVVLLSPGCASFDMFEDFEDRGRKFKDLVNRL